MKGLYTILLLIFSNIFMTFAWYGHLKLQEMKIINNWPLIGVILLSWSMALAPNSRQPHRLPRQRRSLFTRTVKGDTGSHYPDYFCCLYHDFLSGRNTEMEPHRSCRLSGTRRLFRIYEITLPHVKIMDNFCPFFLQSPKNHST